MKLLLVDEMLCKYIISNFIRNNFCAEEKIAYDYVKYTQNLINEKFFASNYGTNHEYTNNKNCFKNIS